MSAQIREPRPEDEAAWRRLWAGYNEFYAATVAPEVTDHTWARILDKASPLSARLIENDGEVVGFTVYVLHEGSWVATPICYLEDLFVDPAQRGKGFGGALIEDLLALGRKNNWSRLYWHTQTKNPARKLYDRFVEADDFVRYLVGI